jgi:integrase/recombinase XerC
MAYAERTKRPPRTLTDREVKKILKVTGDAKAGFRDHVIISLALGCGLRESEIVGLNVGDVATDKDVHKPRRIIKLRVFKRSGKDVAQFVHVPPATYYKLEKYLAGVDDSLRPYPLFWSRKHKRLSQRRVREMWRNWQILAGFDRLYRFHDLRHTAITNVRKVSSIKHAQIFARHANLATTARYDHVSDEELAEAVKDLVA